MSKWHTIKTYAYLCRLINSKLYLGKMKSREELSEKYIRGNGIEIGALLSPLKTFNDAKMKYVDRFGEDGLRKHYPEIGIKGLIQPDIIDNGEILDKIENDSLDFIIANHFMEHTENFIGTLRNHLNKVKVSGILYYAIPNKNETFDFYRECSTFEETLEDEKDNGIGNRYRRYKDWVENVGIKYNKHVYYDIEQEMKGLMARQYSIHFYVWDYESFKKMIEQVKDYLNNFSILEYVPSSKIENILILRREK
ncbi:MAG: hypothetical protein AB1306_03365 [Nitrospirota bacterium]